MVQIFKKANYLFQVMSLHAKPEYQVHQTVWLILCLGSNSVQRHNNGSSRWRSSRWQCLFFRHISVWSSGEGSTYVSLSTRSKKLLNSMKQKQEREWLDLPFQQKVSLISLFKNGCLINSHQQISLIIIIIPEICRQQWKFSDEMTPWHCDSRLSIYYFWCGIENYPWQNVSVLYYTFYLIRLELVNPKS